MSTQIVAFDLAGHSFGGNAMSQLIDVIGAWKNSMCVVTNLEETTQKACLSHLRQVRRFLRHELGRDPLLSDLTAPMILKFASVKRKGGHPLWPQWPTPWADTTFNKFVFCLRQFAAFLPMYAPDYDVRHLMALQRLKNARSNRRRSPQFEDAMAFLVGAQRNTRSLFDRKMEIAIVTMFLTTGMRSGEVRTLVWGDIREDIITIPPERSKNDEERRIPLNSDLKAALSDYVEVCEDRRRRMGPSDPVWQPYRGEQLGERGLSLRRRDILRRAGREDMIEWCDWHCLRHSFVTRMLEAGIPLTVVAEMVGHKDLQTTGRYRHRPDAVTVLEYAEKCKLAG